MIRTGVFLAASLGAGRMMERWATFRTLELDEQRKAMAGIMWGDDPKLLDETPAANKPIDQCIADTAILIGVRHVLRPVLNIKSV